MTGCCCAGGDGGATQAPNAGTAAELCVYFLLGPFAGACAHFFKTINRLRL